MSDENRIKNDPPYTIVSESELRKDMFSAKNLGVDKIHTEPYLLSEEYWMESIKKEVDRIFELYQIPTKPGLEEISEQGVTELRMLANIYGEYTIRRLIWIKMRESNESVKVEELEWDPSWSMRNIGDIPDIDLENAYPCQPEEDIAEKLISQLYDHVGMEFLTGRSLPKDVNLTHDKIKKIMVDFEAPTGDEKMEALGITGKAIKHYITSDFHLGIGRQLSITNQSSHGHGHEISTNGRGHKKVVTGKAGNKYPVPKRRGVR